MYDDRDHSYLETIEAETERAAIVKYRARHSAATMPVVAYRTDLEVGDTVRENWSGIAGYITGFVTHGTVKKARVRYPSGRTIEGPVDHLVKVER
jgi:hypothetical protein